MVETLRALDKKRDFLRRMQKSDLGLMVGSGVTADEAASFLAALA